MGNRFALAWAAWLVFAPVIWSATPQAGAHYLGPEVCALCHKAIAATQSQTAMAGTWQTGRTTWLPPDFRAEFAEGPKPLLLSWIRRMSDQFTYSTSLPGQTTVGVPVEAIVGGKRHGVGFLTRVSELNGSPLARPVLMQARYAWSVREGKLVLAPGCPEAKPRNYQTAFGVALSPEYERRCLECHGQPNTLGAGAGGGVQCETCHGPGSAHLQAIAKGNSRTGIINPKRLNADDSIAVCAQCHVGLTKFSDPEPDDLLVANQVLALQSSECFIQSRHAITCSTCHNPHEDAPAAAETSGKACLGCHSTEVVPHAAICPVNAETDCLSCHMPGVDIGPFHLVDHLIRVHPEQHFPVPATKVNARSQIPPQSEYLEAIEMGGAGQAREVNYLGRKELSELAPSLASAAMKLAYGQTSEAVVDGDGYLKLRRLPRDFKWQAARLQDSADVHLARGDLRGAMAQSQGALAIYPQSLRALVASGRVLSENGEFARAVNVLQKAVALYPNDANAANNLARNLGKLGRSSEAIAGYRRAIVSDSDFVSAYLNLGKALLALNDTPGAIATFRNGLRIDPLSPALYRELGLALSRQGDRNGAEDALQTARKIEAGTSSVP